MSVTTSRRHFLGALIGLVTCLVWFALTPTDIWLQQFFFDFDDHHWIWSRTEPLTRLLIYDGPKMLLIAFGIGLAVCLASIRFLPSLRPYASGIRVVLLSLILVPATVGVLKNTTNIPCPRDYIRFGGKLTFVGSFDSNPTDERSISRYKCFPAGHASGGFALLSLCFLFRSARNRRRAICAALAAGWTMGLYKMLIGDHFVSHTVTTMLLAWMIIHAIVLAHLRLSKVDLIPTETQWQRD